MMHLLLALLLVLIASRTGLSEPGEVSDSSSSSSSSSSSLDKSLTHATVELASGSISSVSPPSADSSLLAPSVSIYQSLGKGSRRPSYVQSRNEESLLHILPPSLYLQNGYSFAPMYPQLSLRSFKSKNHETFPITMSKVFTNVERTVKQIPMYLYNLLSSFKRRGDSNELSRQIFDMVDIVTDVAMLTLIGIPVLGLVAVGATALSPLLGASSQVAASATSASSSSLPSTSSSTNNASPASANSRIKRSILDAIIASDSDDEIGRSGNFMDSLTSSIVNSNNDNSNNNNNNNNNFGGQGQESPGFIERASNAILYTKKLYDVVAKLDDLFETYGVTGNDCQLRAICDVHRVGRNSEYRDFGDTILSLFKTEASVEKFESIPLARLFFQMYSDAAKYGTSLQDCSVLYPRCERETISFVKRKNKTGSKGKKNTLFKSI